MSVTSFLSFIVQRSPPVRLSHEETDSACDKVLQSSDDRKVFPRLPMGRKDPRSSGRRPSLWRFGARGLLKRASFWKGGP